ncbi:MAG: hypothetical protein WBP54_11265 [Pelodictyon phaeoclathratiforme]
MTNIFENVANKVRNSPTVILVFLASLAMLVIGINHFIEDTYSSYIGLQWIQDDLGMNPASWKFTYFTMSIAPQIAQIVFTYMFMSNPEKNRWAFWASFAAFCTDFVSDSWYRSNEGLFTDPVKFIVASVITVVFFTIGSEGFITVGIGLVAELINPFIIQFRRLVSSIFDAFLDKATGAGGQQRHQQQPHPQRPPIQRPTGGAQPSPFRFQDDDD